jgi:hypothetical protein
VICPATSERNLTPTSTALGSESEGLPGVADASKMEHGQVAAAAGAAGATMSTVAASARHRRNDRSFGKVKTRS